MLNFTEQQAGNPGFGVMLVLLGSSPILGAIPKATPRGLKAMTSLHPRAFIGHTDWIR